MITAHITVEATTTTVAIDTQQPTTLHGAGQSEHAQAMKLIRDHAARAQDTIDLHVDDNGRQYHLHAGPDGQISTAPAAEPPPVPAPTPSPEPLTIPRVDQSPPTSAADTPPPPASDPPTQLDTSDTDEIQAVPPAPRAGASAPSVDPAPPAPAEPGPSPVVDLSPPAPTDAPDPVEDDPRWAEIASAPATQGFRGTLNKLGLNLSPAADELDERRTALRRDLEREQRERDAAAEEERTRAANESRRAARAREQALRDRQRRDLIQTNFGHCQTVTVANQKGGSHKTTATALLAATFGRLRSGGILAWDANETVGTLGFRTQDDLHTRTVVDLLEHADEFNDVSTSRLGTIDRYSRAQGDDRFTVLASDEDPERQDMVDGDGFRTIHEILSRFTRMILVDTGNNGRASHFLAAIEATDQLVIPISAGRDSSHVAEEMMQALRARGHTSLVANAVVLLHDSESRRVDDSETAHQLGSKVGAVIPIPHDPALVDGKRIDYDALQDSTKNAYLEAAAAIASNLRAKVIS